MSDLHYLPEGSGAIVMLYFSALFSYLSFRRILTKFLVVLNLRCVYPWLLMYVPVACVFFPFFDVQLFITVGFVATLAHPHRQTVRRKCIVGEVHWHARSFDRKV